MARVLDSHTARIPELKTLAAQSGAILWQASVFLGPQPATTVPNSRLGRQRLSLRKPGFSALQHRSPTASRQRSVELGLLCFGTSLNKGWSYG